LDDKKNNHFSGGEDGIAGQHNRVPAADCNRLMCAVMRKGIEE
jgi:hypothetical protein